jgi:MFS family permease
MAIIADNFGRRITVVISSLITFFGCLILVFSQNLWMASIALILCGMGSDSTLATLGSIAAESLDDNYRQKVSSIVQGAFTVGALLVTLFYYLFEDWKISSIYCLSIPALINTVIIITFVKESPMYLIIESP